MAGGVTSAVRNVPIHSRSVQHFAGRIEIENALVVELACPFGWTGSPGEYEVIGGAIALVHGSHGNRDDPTVFFNYHWVDDHSNVAADVGTNCEDMGRSLRYAMTAILGSGAVNEDKFTEWNTRQKILGLQFDTIAETIAIPAVKIAKARNLVASALAEPDVVVEMDACDHGLCALDTKANIALTYRFSPHELQPFARFKTGEANGSTSIFGTCSPAHLLPANGANGVPGGPRVLRKDVAPSTYIFVSTILRPWPGKTALRHVTPAPKTLSGCPDTGRAISTSVSRLPILPGSTTPAQTPARALQLTRFTLPSLRN
ncbi:unnamed protein product [Phytophthora fragariaefolia]|uniref:Unnamed protein product n=1 Tax=Phytophthora fragariaefolia TaxID=1490495 RepID=A0A9W7CQM5_9STRA|nr:unnamed protein product [Phytophthora fragariaefolia]